MSTQNRYRAVHNTLLSSIERALSADYTLPENTRERLTLELTGEKQADQGDLATNAALVLAKVCQENPRTLAEKIRPVLEALPEVASVLVAGPGFINITLADKTWKEIALDISASTDQFFAAQTNSSKKYLIEFVSANPTGPLHIGHGRNAILGDALARILRFNGHDVTTEFYINDAGSQIAKLGRSIQLRLEQLQSKSRLSDLPEGHYNGQYITEIAEELLAQHGPTVSENAPEFFSLHAQNILLAQQQETLTTYRVTFDNWFSEKSLYSSHKITDALDRLERAGLLYTEDNALWFKATEFGDDKDRVLRKADGSYTYITPDIAYHADKFERKYDHIIDILGQDHHGYVLRLKGTLSALGYNAEKLSVLLYQLVSVTQGDQLIKMSKRAGTFTTLDDIIQAIGVDAARFFYLNKKADSHLELDLEKALTKSTDNPLYYLQYAYVRTLSILRKGEELSTDNNKNIFATPFTHPEKLVLKKILGLRSVLTAVENSLQPHLLTLYAHELAQQFHRFYTNNRVLDPSDPETTDRRLALVHLVKETLGLLHDILGISRQEVM